MIPKNRIPIAVSSKNRPMKTVRPKAIAPYTEHFFLLRRMIVNTNAKGLGKECLGHTIKLPKQASNRRILLEQHALRLGPQGFRH